MGVLILHVKLGEASGSLILWRTKQQNRGQVNTNTKICVAPRGTSASSSFGGAVGDSLWEQHSMEKHTGQRMMQVVLVWHEMHWRRGTQDILEHQALNLDAFSALLAPFFVYHYATF